MKIKFLAALLPLTISMFAQTTYGEDLYLTINNAPVILYPSPVIQNGRTLVPLRSIFESLGAHVEWISESQTIVASKRLNKISLQIGQKEMLKNGESIALDIPAQIINDNTFVPLRAVSEALDCDVTWDDATKLAQITTKQKKHTIADHYLTSDLVDPDTQTTVLHTVASYPEILDSKTLGVQSVNQAIKQVAYTYLESTKAEASQLAQEEYQSLTSDFRMHSFEQNFDVTYDSNTVYSVLFQQVENTGGAHPNSYRSGYVYNLTTGSSMALTDILNGTQEENMEKIYNAFAEQIRQNPDSYFPDAEATLKENLSSVSYYLSENGLECFFPLYTLAPYAAGFSTITIPYGDGSNFKFLQNAPQ